MNIGHDDEEELSSVLWRLHFTTERVVSSVVSGVYEIPQDVLVNLNDSTDATFSTPMQPRRGCRRVIFSLPVYWCAVQSTLGAL